MPWVKNIKFSSADNANNSPAFNMPGFLEDVHDNTDLSNNLGHQESYIVSLVYTGLSREAFDNF